MTEAEWLACENAWRLLEQVRKRASPRKLRLFACACERRPSKFRQPGPLGDKEQAVERVIEAAERHAEGEAGASELKAAFDAAGRGLPGRDCTRASPIQAAKQSENGAYWHIYWFSKLPKAEKEAQRAAFAGLARCVLGNPFRPVSFDAEWRTPAVLSLAQAAYDERALPSGEMDPARLAVLADALEEAGCANEDLLAHLRSVGPHVRGCWAVDLVLGKE